MSLALKIKTWPKSTGNTMCPIFTEGFLYMLVDAWVDFG